MREIELVLRGKQWGASHCNETDSALAEWACQADGIENENQHVELITLDYCKPLENDSTPSARRSCKIGVVAQITTTVPLTATTGVITEQTSSVPGPALRLQFHPRSLLYPHPVEL